MIKLSQKDRLRIVNDQIGTPTYAPDIALATIEIINKIMKKTLKKYIILQVIKVVPGLNLLQIFLNLL